MRVRSCGKACLAIKAGKQPKQAIKAIPGGAPIKAIPGVLGLLSMFKGADPGGFCAVDTTGEANPFQRRVP